MGRSIQDAAKDYFGGSVPKASQGSSQQTGASSTPGGKKKAELNPIQQAAARWENSFAKQPAEVPQSAYQRAVQWALDDAVQEHNYVNSGLSREEYYQQMQAAATRAGKKATGMSLLYNPNAAKHGDKDYDPFASKGSDFISKLWSRYVLNKQNLKEEGADHATFKDYITGKFEAPTKEQREAAERKTEQELARFNNDKAAYLEGLMKDTATANAALAYAEQHRYDDELSAMKADPISKWKGITAAREDAARANEEYENYIRSEKESADQAFQHFETGHVTLAPGLVDRLRNANDALIEGRSNITGRIQDRREYYPQEGWTADQVQLHGYLYATDRDRADQYAMAINQRLNYEAGKAKAEEIAKDGVTKGEWAKAQGARFASGVDYFLNAAEYNLEGGVNASGTPHITNNDQVASFNQIANAVDTAISNNLNGYDPMTQTYSRVLDEDIPVVGGKGWGDAYQLGMSILQSALASATGPVGTYTIFFGSAAQSSYEQALERGATQGQALTLGALNGIAEGLFEAVSIDKVKGLSKLAADRSTVLSWLRAIGISGFIEGSEELNTGIADLIIDAAVMGGNSETQEAIRSYMAQGMSYDEAWKAAFMGNLNNLAYDALGGAISGALHGNIFTGAGLIRNAATTYQGDARALMQEAMERGVKGARQVGAHENVKLSNYQANKLQAGIIKNAGGVENYIQEKTTQAEADFKTVRNVLETLEILDDYDAAALMSGFRTGSANALDYAEGVKQAFTAGRIGLSLEQAREQFGDTKLTKRQFEKAFEIGQKNQTPDIQGAKAKIDGRDYSIRMKGSDTVVFTSANGKTIEMTRTEALTRDGVEIPKDVAKLLHATEQFGENAGEIYNLYTGNMGIDSYAAAMNSAIHWAENGVLRQRIESGRALGQRTNLTRLTDEQIALAEKIGEAHRTERKASAKARSESFEKKAPRAGKYGRVIMNGAVTARGEKLKGIDLKNLNKQQKDAVRAIRTMANLVQIDYIIYDGVRAGTNTEGNEAEKAWGFYEDGKVYININAGTGNDYIAVATLAHELTHFMQDLAGNEYEQLRDEIIRIYYNNDPAEFERVVQLRMKTGGENGKTLSHDAAVDEVIANSCMEMLNDTDAIDQLCADKPKLGQQILDFLTKLIKDIFGDINRIPFDENSFYRAHYDEFNGARERFAAGLKKAAENAQKGEAAAEGRKNMAWNGGELERSYIDYSNKEGMEAAYDEKLKSLEERGKLIDITEEEVAAQQKNAEWTNLQKARQYIRKSLQKIFGTESVIFSDNGTKIEAYLTKDGRKHTAGAITDPVEAAALVKAHEFIAASEYVFSSNHDVHSAKGANISTDTVWDYFEAGARYKDATIAIRFNLRDIPTDVREQIYKIGVNENGAVPNNRVQETERLVDRTTPSDDIVADLVENSKGSDAETVAEMEAAEATGRQLSRFVEDPETLKFLEDQEKAGKVVRTYKSFLKIDGKLYPPMASLQKDENGKYKLAHAMEEGRWEESVGNPKNIIVDEKTGKGYFNLKKDNGKTVKAAYNPYQHSSNLMLNDQFEEAYQRPQLVTYECIIPESELTSGYRADYAKDAVGLHPWKAGPVAGKLKSGNQRNVYLSRWLKPVREVPAAEVAQHYKQLLDGTDIAVPFNVVTPELLSELEKAGVKIDREGSPMYKARAKRNEGRYEAAAREAETERKPVQVDAQNAQEEATFTEDGKTYPLRQYSLKSMEYDIQDGKMFDDLARYTSMSEKEIEDLRSGLTHLMDAIALHRDILDMNETYGKKDRPFKAFKPNSDPLYTLSLDFSTLCRKRLMTQYVIEKLQTELKDSETGETGRALSAEEQLAVRDLMKEYGKQEKALKVACAMCYVEAARLKAPKQINKFLRDPKSAMLRYFALKNKEFNDSVKQAQADFKVSRGYAANTAKKDMKPADVTALNKLSGKLRDEYGSKAHPASEEELEAIRIARSLPRTTFLTAANLARLAEEHPLIYDAYTATIRTATRSKSLEADIPYYYGDSYGEVSDEFIRNVNAENGMRFSSWSDFQIEHMLDMMTAVIELSTRKCAMHGYTKFLEQVRIFGKTGMMFNMSGVPQGTGLKADGSLDFSPTESVLVKSEDGSEYDAITARNEFPETAGLQCIGISNEHIFALLASDIIDYVIPYHTSGLNASLRRMAQISNWSDFTSFQNASEDKSIKFDEKIHDKDTWHKEPVFSEFFNAAKDPANGYKEGEAGIETMRRAANLYKKMCAERGLRPKFSWGNSKVDADFSNDPNYWKLLIDRKMINQKTGALIEQKPVTPTFDFSEIEKRVQEAVDAYDSTLQDRALGYVREHLDELPKRISDLKKSGAVKKAKADAKKADELSKRFNELQAGVVAAATEGSVKQAEADAQNARAYQTFRDSDDAVNAQTRVNELRENIKALQETEEFRNLVDRVSNTSGDEQMAAINEYGNWLRSSGMNDMIRERDALEDGLNEYRRREAEEYENREAAEEREAIEKSGLSEEDYFRRQAVKEFGYTPYFYDAGYILPDGKLLNFSGEKGKHHGTRGQDHRAIETIYATVSRTQAMLTFMRQGNVRVNGETPGIDISNVTEPTSKQYAAIRRFAQESRGKDFFNVDFTDENGTPVGNLYYEGTISPERVVNDVKHYFQTGEVREQGLSRFYQKYSEAEENAVGLFGTTDNYAQAGYILRDGKMLDFSGKKQDDREYDHRAIAMAYGEDVDLDNHHGFDSKYGHYLEEFVEGGAVRMFAGDPDLNMNAGMQLSRSRELSSEQEQAIRGFVEWLNDRNDNYVPDEYSLSNGPTGLVIDFGGDARYFASGATVRIASVPTLVYSGARIRADRVINDIRHFYRTGEIRSQGVSRFYQKYDGQLSFDDMGDDYSRSQWNAEYRQRIETAEELTERVKNYLTQRGVDPEELEEYGARESYFNRRGDIDGAADMIRRLSDLSQDMNGTQRQEAYELMEELLPHAESETLGLYTTDEGPVNPAFAEWYNNRNPSLYYPGYTPGDLMLNTHWSAPANDWIRTRDNVEKEIDYLKKLLKRDNLSAEFREDAEDFLKRLDAQQRGKNDEVFYQKYVPDMEETAEERDSRKAAEIRAREEKQLLHETVVSLNRELKKLNWKLSGENEVREDDCLKLARQYKKTYGSTVNTQELAAKIKALGDYIVSAEELDDARIRADAEAIAYLLIDSAREVEDMWSMRNQDLERHQDAASRIQGKKFYYPENLRGDLAREGGYNSFRRANMGRFTLSSKGGDSIDAFYTELHDTYPDLFPELTNEGDQIIRMAEIFEEAKPDMVNPFAYEDDNFLTEVANGIFEDVLGEGIRQKAPSLMARVNLTEAAIEDDGPALSGAELAQVQKDLAAIGKELEAVTAKADALEKRWATVSANEELAQKKLANAEDRIQRLSDVLRRESLSEKLTEQQKKDAQAALKKAMAEKAKLEKLLQKAKENTAQVRQERNEIRKGRREAEQKRDSLQRKLNRETARNAALQVKLSDNAQRTRDRLAALRAEKNARIEQIRAEGAAKVEEVRATEKAEKWARVASERERYQQMAERARERRIEAQTRGTLRKRITKMYNEFVRDITHPTEGHHVPPEMMRQAVDVLQALNMDTSREGTKSGERLREKLAKLKVTYDAIQNDKDFRNAAVYDETVSGMLQAMIEEVGDTPINRMTGRQMESVYNVLVAMRTTARTALKIKMQGEERDAYEVARKMTNEVRSGQKPNKGVAGYYLNMQLTPERMFNRLGGYHKNSTWSQAYRMLNEGQLESTRIFVEGSRIFEKLLNSKDYDGYVSPKNTVDIGLKDEAGNVVPVTHDMLVSLWMHLQNESNTKHAILGGLTIPNQKQYYAGNRTKGNEESIRVLGPALPELQRALELREQAQQTEDEELKKELWKEIGDLREKAMAHATTLRNKVADSMTAYDRQWAMALTELFDVYSKEQLNKTTMEVYGIKRASVEHYWPISVDSNFLNTPFDSIARDFSIENAGFMKERVDSSKPIRLYGSSDVASSQLRKVSQYSGLMPVIRNFNKIWGKTQIGYQDSLKNAVEQVYGKTGMDYIENLMADLNGARSGQESPFGQALNKLRGNMAQAALTLSMRTAFGQTASYPTAAAVVGWKPLMQAFVKGGKYHWMFSRADRELIERYSPLLRYRSMGYSTTELGDISTSNSRMARLWKKMRWMTGWIQAMDSATVGRLWYAAEYYVDDHNKALKKGTDAYYEEVAKVFNDIVEKTQPDYTTMQRPDILRNPNALVRSLTMFMTQRLQNANIMYDAAATYAQARKDYAAGTYGVTKEDVQQAAVNTKRAATSLIVAGVTITAFKFLADVVLHSMNAYRDDDKDLTGESVGLQLTDMFLDSMIGNMLFGSEVYKLVESKVFGKTYYGIEVSGVSTVSDVAKDMSNLFDKIRESGFKVGEYKSELNKMAKDVAQLLGIPLSNGEKIVMGIINHGRDIANGEFFKFEAGVERKTSQNARRLYNAYERGDERTADSILEEAEDKKALRSELTKYIKTLYKEGEISAEEATDQLTEYAEIWRADAEREIKKITFQIDYGFEYDDIRERYLSGEMTASEAKSAMVKYGGKSETAAADDLAFWKEKDAFDKRYGTEYEYKYSLSYSGAKAYYTKWRNLVSLEKFAEQWEKYGNYVVTDYYEKWRNTGLTIDQYSIYKEGASKCKGTDLDHDGKTDSGSKKAEVLKVIDALPVSNEVKDAIYEMNEWSMKWKYLKEAPWHR